MVKRLRRDTEDIESLASYNSQPVSISTTARNNPNEGDNTLPSIGYSHHKAHGTSSRGTALKCLLPPHPPLSFSTQSEFETHYQKDHVTRCNACGKNFPTEHYLNLHIAENHDPINEVLKQNHERIYGCFVEGCDRKCSNPQKRRRHLIDKHQFPKNYDFYIINDGLDNRISLLRASPRESKAEDIISDKINDGDNTNPVNDLSVGLESPEKSINSRIISGHAVRRLKLSESPIESSDDKTRKQMTGDVDSIVSSMSALDLVPRSVRIRKRWA